MKIKKGKTYIKFKNGVEVQLPKGWRFGEKFEIIGIIYDKPLTKKDIPQPHKGL